jgi:hypothetical protein
VVLQRVAPRLRGEEQSSTATGPLSARENETTAPRVFSAFFEVGEGITFWKSKLQRGPIRALSASKGLEKVTTAERLGGQVLVTTVSQRTCCPSFSRLFRCSSQQMRFLGALNGRASSHKICLLLKVDRPRHRVAETSHFGPTEDIRSRGKKYWHPAVS